MAIYVGGNKIKEIFVGSTRIKAVYLGSDLIWQYDSTAPSLTVDIAGTSSNSPTYVQSDSALDYTVTGTVSDADSGVKSVTANGVAATINADGTWRAVLPGLATNTTHTITVTAVDNAGNEVTVNRYLRVVYATKYLYHTGTNDVAWSYLGGYWNAGASTSGITIASADDSSLKAKSLKYTTTSAGRYGLASCITNSMYDLSKYTKLVVDGYSVCSNIGTASTNRMGLGLSTSKSTSGTFNETVALFSPRQVFTNRSSTGNFTVTYDISSITGSYYVCCFNMCSNNTNASESAQFQIKNVYLTNV